MKTLLNLMYKKYPEFRNLAESKDVGEENTLFHRLNVRVRKMFPQIAQNQDSYFNPIIHSIKKSDFWAVPSETYFNELIKSDSNFKFLEKYKIKGGVAPYGSNYADSRAYQEFNADNFRELRILNKKYILREFSEQRIKTRFIDSILFKDKNYTVKGYLDSFYDSPLLMCRFSNDIFSDGVDIAFDTILKLFELYKNIQVIISIPNGLSNNFVKQRIEFLEKNTQFAGRWIYFDTEINLPYFYAASDMTLLPKRINTTENYHYLAMKYGCVPVVSNIGIFNDSIYDIFEDVVLGCGFKTTEKLLDNPEAYNIFFNKTYKAIEMYAKNPKSWNLIIKNSIKHDCGWNFNIIEKYNEIYENI